MRGLRPAGRAPRPVRQVLLGRGPITLAVRLPNWLGDALLARRALEALAAAAPEPTLWAAPAPLVSLLAADFPHANWMPTESGLASAWALGAAWRRLGVERVVSFPVSASARVAALRSGATVRFGFGPRAGERRERDAAWGVTRVVARTARGERHAEDEYLDLARAAGASERPRRDLLLPRLSVEAAERLVSGLSGYVALAPGARYGPAKRWPAERFADAGREAAARLGAERVVIVGEEADRAACAAVAGRLGTAALDLCGRTDAIALAGVLARAAAVLSNDSGAAHLGAALGRPTVAVFGSTDPRWTAPRGERATSVWDRVRCAPCFRRTCPWLDAYACLHMIEPRQVVAALERVLPAAQAAAS